MVLSVLNGLQLDKGVSEVSKKKKRYKRRKKPKNRRIECPYIKDCHHILWQKNKWTQGSIRRLRDHHYCKIYIPRNTLHYFIHQSMVEIPVPREMDAKAALWHLQYLEDKGGISDKDPFEKRLLVLIALFDCASQPTADALRKQLEIVREFNKKPLA